MKEWTKRSWNNNPKLLR